MTKYKITAVLGPTNTGKTKPWKSLLDSISRSLPKMGAEDGGRLTIIELPDQQIRKPLKST